MQADSDAYTLVRLAASTGARQQQLRCHRARMGQTRVGAGRQRGRHHGVPLEHTMRERRSGPGRAPNTAACVLAGSHYKGKLRDVYNRRLYGTKRGLGSDAAFTVRVFPLVGCRGHPTQARVRAEDHREDCTALATAGRDDDGGARIVSKDVRREAQCEDQRQNAASRRHSGPAASAPTSSVTTLPRRAAFPALPMHCSAPWTTSARAKSICTAWSTS